MNAAAELERRAKEAAVQQAGAQENTAAEQAYRQLINSNRANTARKMGEVSPQVGGGTRVEMEGAGSPAITRRKVKETTYEYRRTAEDQIPEILQEVRREFSEYGIEAHVIDGTYSVKKATPDYEIHRIPVKSREPAAHYHHGCHYAIIDENGEEGVLCLTKSAAGRVRGARPWLFWGF